MSRGEGKQRWKPVIAVFGVSVIVAIALLEMALYFLDDRYKNHFRVPPVSSENFQEEANAFFHSERFDADLGWDYRPPVRNYLEHKVFLAQAYGLELSLGVQFTIVIIALLTSIGVAGVPSASLVAIAIILNAVGLPVEAIGVLMVFDRVLDMCRTSVNIWGDACCATIVARLRGEKTKVDIADR